MGGSSEKWTVNKQSQTDYIILIVLMVDIIHIRQLEINQDVILIDTFHCMNESFWKIPI